MSQYHAEESEGGGGKSGLQLSGGAIASLSALPCSSSSCSRTPMT